MMKIINLKVIARLFSSSLRLSLALGAVGVFASVGFAADNAKSAGAHKDTYYVNDHLASTVATADAAGEIAQIEADAFGTQTGAVAKDSRFTGKPYDADMGAFVFPFRNYRSDEARWMSADPSGFPDGTNAFSYIKNSLSAVDSLGLWHVELYSGSSDSGSWTKSNGFFVERYAHTEATLNAYNSSFFVFVQTFAHTTTGLAPIYDFGYAGTTDAGGTLSATSDGRIELNASSTFTSLDSDGMAQAAAGVTYQYLNNQKEVEINFTWGGAHLGAGGIAMNVGSPAGWTVGVTSGPLAHTGGLNTLRYRVVE